MTIARPGWSCHKSRSCRTASEAAWPTYWQFTQAVAARPRLPWPARCEPPVTATTTELRLAIGTPGPARRPAVRAGSANFDEMRLADSLAIWSRSIEMAASHGPLVGYFVAGHFTRLLRRVQFLAQERGLNEPLARGVLDPGSTTRQDGPLARTMVAAAGGSTGQKVVELPTMAARRCAAFRICNCSTRSASGSVVPSGTSPGGSSWPRARVGRSRRWASRPAGNRLRRCRIEPWPMARAPSQSLAVSGWAIPRRRYQSTDELLAATINPNVTLEWCLVP